MDSGTTIKYFITYSRRRSISMKFRKDGNLSIAAPYGVSEKYIKEFIDSRRNWIIKNYNAIKKNLLYVEQNGYYSDLDIKDMKKKSKDIITSRVLYYAKKGNFSFNRITYKVMKTQWGSCSGKRNLNFNCVLSLMPLSIIDSVVVHELCHLRHMDHSKEFYKEVYALCPTYNECHKWLKINGPRYLARINKD